MVSGHGKLRDFFLDIEISELVLQRELVTEAQAVVKHAETDVHVHAVFPAQFDQHLVIVVPDAGFLSPDGLPGLVQAVRFHGREGEAFLQVFSLHEFESQM